MTYNQLMTESLSNLLEEGEELICPVYGVLDQGGRQTYGFFGLTETDLLIVLIAGKTVTYTTRVPLDIRSFHIKRTAVFRQYEIYIQFREGGPCKIVAAPRVAMIKSQKENLPRFVELLGKRARDRAAPTPTEVQGERIRRRYFGALLEFMLLVFSIPLVMVPAAILKDSGFDFAAFASEVSELIATLIVGAAIFLVPALLVWLISLRFGRVIGTIADGVLVLHEDRIPLACVKKIEYEHALLSRVRSYPSRATFHVDPPWGQPYTVEVADFPRYGLKKIKKRYPSLTIVYTDRAIRIIFAVGVPMISLLAGLVML